MGGNDKKRRDVLQLRARKEDDPMHLQLINVTCMKLTNFHRGDGYQSYITVGDLSVHWCFYMRNFKVREKILHMHLLKITH